MLTLSYYVKRVRLAATYLGTLFALLLVLIVLSGRPPTLSSLVAFLTFSVEPKSDVEALATLIAMLINMSPVLGVVELKSATLEEKAALRAEHMSDHVIVVGYGHLGARVCKALERSRIPFVLIVKPEDYERNEEVREMMRRGIGVVLGDASQEWVLRRASVDKAKALVVTVNDDTLNLVVAEKAKKINPALRVVTRIYSEDLAEIALRSGFADEAFSTTKVVYPLFVAACFCDVRPVPNVVPLEVPEGSPFVGRSIRDVEGVLGVPVLAAVRPGGELARDPQYAVRPGDFLLVIGDPGKVAESFRVAASPGGRTAERGGQ